MKIQSNRYNLEKVQSKRGKFIIKPPENIYFIMNILKKIIMQYLNAHMKR